MKFFIGGLLLVYCGIFSVDAQDPFKVNIPVAEKLIPFTFGSIKPKGWIEAQMRGDLDGFVGHLDSLVPTLIYDDIYNTERLTKLSKLKELGTLKEGDAGGDEQYMWWNSETQSNWWDGYLRNALLLGDERHLARVKNYIERVLASQDADGYIGIYAPDLRYKFTSENGELWAKATLYRGLLGYYEAIGDDRVWKALVRAVDNVMVNYPVYASDPFNVGTAFSGGVAHGLTFTDVLDRMWQLTGDRKYSEYALFLYRNYSSNYSSETDAQYKNIMDPGYKLQMHAVHTYEHLRPLLTSYYATGSDSLKKALSVYTERIRKCQTPTGAPIGDEWIGRRIADATDAGYEYCSIHELLDSYTMMLQKSGYPALGADIEKIFYNAAQGARHPSRSCIAYLKTDNSFEMNGTRNGYVEPNRNQTRYKYSPAHQDVAVCCNPNAGRVTPYFVKSMFLRDGDAIVAPVLGPCELTTTIGGRKLVIHEETDYPYSNQIKFRFETSEGFPLTFKVRQPEWADNIKSSHPYKSEDGCLVFIVQAKTGTVLELTFDAKPVVHPFSKNEHYVTYGPLVFARPVEYTETPGKKYSDTLGDWMYLPVKKDELKIPLNPKVKLVNGEEYPKLRTQLMSGTKMVEVDLVPVGKTILRQVTFNQVAR
jgi:uncharacterized protein